MPHMVCYRPITRAFARQLAHSVGMSLSQVAMATWPVYVPGGIYLCLDKQLCWGIMFKPQLVN